MASTPLAEPSQNFPPRRGRTPRDEPKGQVYDLDLYFDTINRVIFNNGLERPVLRWSNNRWTTTLGLCNIPKKVITMNTVLDDARVPDVVVAGVMHHEMLHLFFGISEGPNGGRRFHTPEFRAAEKRFPGYEATEKWVKENWPLRGRPAKKPRTMEHSFLQYLSLLCP